MERENKTAGLRKKHFMSELQMRLERIKKEFSKGELNLKKLLEREFGIDFSASYLSLDLRNPVIVAPGPLSQRISQIERAAIINEKYVIQFRLELWIEVTNVPISCRFPRCLPCTHRRVFAGCNSS